MEPHTNYANKLVKVFGHQAKDHTCKFCGAPVSWYRTANKRRWVLFNRAVRVWKERTDADGVLFKYLDFKGIHWHECPGRASSRPPARAGLRRVGSEHVADFGRFQHT